ncbi:MAG: hypothetical protein A2017_21830 [Lentisphaerae bacterium GWF2_44_16]|nr:MAG: hypothetical protein A2017_21830 [Lentisphaerae bacterium GWF2_44_16]
MKEMGKEIKIVTTDSGLGGLSITALLAERLKKERQFERVNLTFFNCRPSDEIGYDNLPDNETRASVFSNALYSIQDKLKPDIILIACNTLSVIFDKTDFSKKTTVPVIGIVSNGVNEIYEYMKTDNDLRMIMFATPTTVISNVHRKMLEERGISPDRLIYQECRGLAGEIEKGAEEKVRSMIEDFMRSAASETVRKPISVSLLCTHFDYVHDIFREEAGKILSFNGKIINPNSGMVANFLNNFPERQVSKTDISIKVMTQTRHTREMKRALVQKLEDTSSAVASAFENDILEKNFFEYSF